MDRPTSTDANSDAPLDNKLVGQTPDNDQKLATASGNIMKAFATIRIMAYVFGRLPFQIAKKKNGMYAFVFKKYSAPAIYFYITSSMLGIIFFMLCIGYVSIFFDVNVSKVKDRCQVTWESFNLLRTAVPTAITVSWLYLTLSGSIYTMFRGKEYLHYLNYWNRAIAILNCDPSEGARRSALIDNAHCLMLILLFTGFYGSKQAPSLHEGAASIANALVRLFIQDIGISEEFSKIVSNQSDCNMRKKVYSTLDYDSASFTVWKLLGFIIQIYALYGSLCVIIQFRFYCRLLRNMAYIWNERFQNLLHGVSEDPSDQNKRRLSLRFIMKDHLIVVQMFKLTENAFASTLQSFYTVQIVNMCSELYFLSAMRGVSTCDKLITDLQGEQQVIVKACLKLDKDLDLAPVLKSSSSKFFADPCSPVQFKILQEAIVALVLLLQTLRITFSITMDASLAYEEAMRGFQILRRHCYMYCYSRRERNFIHSLIFSFAGNNPIHITAGKYFVVNKALISVIAGSIFTYYVILLQFRPGNFDTKDFCVESVCSDLNSYKEYSGVDVQCSKVFLNSNSTTTP
ncbi:uncharacterized protein LOC118433839 [Folsomia candida]|uniref:uncharacterized protein LOC118433839 n=1 Tax=Folsomia candida TaxID=158441 RepID=UPI001604E03D|nr:uncharacterized protein LOC118433839 [Folsomia candida]